MTDPKPDTFRKSFYAEDMVNASELREFIFCERAWFLSRRGFAVTPEVQSRRIAGVEFHDEMTAAASSGQRLNRLARLLLFAAAAAALLATILWMRR